mgnify:CR=1 FL=1
MSDNFLVTGFIYTGTPAITAEVTGYPISRGAAGHDITMVGLLTADGEVVSSVRVSTEVIDSVRVWGLGAMSEGMLWRIADNDTFGRGGHALAELAYRERQQVEAQRRTDAARAAKMRADGARLLAGAR